MRNERLPTRCAEKHSNVHNATALCNETNIYIPAADLKHLATEQNIGRGSRHRHGIVNDNSLVGEARGPGEARGLAIPAFELWTHQTPLNTGDSKRTEGSLGPFVPKPSGRAEHSDRAHG